MENTSFNLVLCSIRKITAVVSIFDWFNSDGMKYNTTSIIDPHDPPKYDMWNQIIVVGCYFVRSPPLDKVKFVSHLVNIIGE